MDDANEYLGFFKRLEKERCEIGLMTVYHSSEPESDKIMPLGPSWRGWFYINSLFMVIFFSPRLHAFTLNSCIFFSFVSWLLEQLFDVKLDDEVEGNFFCSTVKKKKTKVTG